jgi:hypothetical protein
MSVDLTAAVPLPRPPSCPSRHPHSFVLHLSPLHHYHTAQQKEPLPHCCLPSRLSIVPSIFLLPADWFASTNLYTTKSRTNTNETLLALHCTYILPFHSGLSPPYMFRLAFRICSLLSLLVHTSHHLSPNHHNASLYRVQFEFLVRYGVLFVIALYDTRTLNIMHI